MSGSVTLTTLLLFAALLRRFFATRPGLRAHGTGARVDRGLDAVVFAGTATLIVIGSWTVLLGLADAARPLWVSVGTTAAAVAAWKPRPRRAPNTGPAVNQGQTPAPAGSWRQLVPHGVALVIVLGAIALRVPPIDSQLAGRDQGTYTLRAQHLHATGSHHVHDPALEWAAQTGQSDVLALWPQPSPVAWREDRYEQGYRPGFYVADRETGAVVPQFLHLHPSVLAIGAWLFGPSHLHVIMSLFSTLALIAMWRVASLVFGRRDLAALALAIYAVLPQVVWTQRMTLSEGLAGLLILAAALAWLRRGPAAARDRWFGVACLVALAGVRGEAWLLVPCVLVAASMEGLPKLHALVGLAGVWLWVALHATSSFPYVHDELVRLAAAWRTATPLRIAGGHALATVAAMALVVLPRPRIVRRLLALAPRLLLAAAVLLVVRRMLAGQPGPPFARLDTALIVLGAPLTALSLIGLALAWPSWTPRRDAPSIAMALAWIPALSALAFARPNLPNVHLYTYGRYLVPSLIPATVLLAMAVAAKVAGPRQQRARPNVRTLTAYALGLGVLIPPLLLYAETPETRLDDHRGAERLITGLAKATPAGSIILAGGEGPHARHAFNHVGGALALAHGRTVLPFADDEQAYAAARMLLQRFDHVYILHDAQSPAVTMEGQITVGVDTPGGPGIEAAPVGLYTLYTHRLTPTVGAIPTRVTRDALHLALFEVVRAPFQSTVLPACNVRDRRVLPASDRTRQVSLQAGLPQTGDTAHWKVVAVSAAGSRPLHRTSVGGRKVPRSTMGPWVVLQGESLEVRGAGLCDATTEITASWSDAPNPNPGPNPEDAVVFEPPRTLGHPVDSIRWRSARTFGRLRRPLDAVPERAGRGLALTPERPLAFAPIAVPQGPCELVVWLEDVEGADEGEGQILVEISDDGWSWRTVTSISPGPGTWMSAPLDFMVPLPYIALRLRSDGPRATLRHATIFAEP